MDRKVAKAPYCNRYDVDRKRKPLSDPMTFFCMKVPGHAQARAGLVAYGTSGTEGSRPESGGIAPLGSGWRRPGDFRWMDLRTGDEFGKVLS